MTENTVATTSESEVIETPEAETTTAPSETKEQEVTVSEALETEQKPQETIGLDKFLAEKQGRKAAEKEKAKLEAELEALKSKKGATQEEVSDDIQAIIDNYPDVDPDFISQIVGVAEMRAGKKAETVVKPITEKEKAEQIDGKFKVHFNKTIDSMPEYQGIVNAEVIKTLSLDPRNAKKTFAQIIEETYGNAIGGKRTLETTTPRGGHEPESVDMKRAATDEKYFEEVMANPKSKAEYNQKAMELMRL